MEEICQKSDKTPDCHESLLCINKRDRIMNNTAQSEKLGVQATVPRISAKKE